MIVTVWLELAWTLDHCGMSPSLPPVLSVLDILLFPHYHRTSRHSLLVMDQRHHAQRCAWFEHEHNYLRTVFSYQDLVHHGISSVI